MRWPRRRSPFRTLLLGIAALAVLLWGAVSQFGIPRETVLSLLVSTTLALLTMMVLAALSLGLVLLLKRLLRRDRSP